MTAPLAWRWFGRVPYDEAWAWQLAWRDAVIAGTEPEILGLFEHDAVVTTGRRPVEGLERVRAAGIPVVSTERGGLATWHGPGQLVGYPIVDVGRRGIRVREWVALIEHVIIAWLGEQGIAAALRPGAPGVWVGRDKICAVGTHFRRGVSMHGFALNLSCDLSACGLFVPCGIADGGVVSASALGCAIDPAQAAPAVGEAFARSVDTATRRHYLSAVPEGM